MIYALHVIYSWPFMAGLVAGALGYWFCTWEACRWRNKHHPRPDGRSWRMGGFNASYVSGVVVLFIIGYILMAAQDTHDQTVKLAKDVARCQVEFNEALTDRSNISTQDIGLANAQSDLRVKQDQARTRFLDRYLNPPANIAGLSRENPLRDQYVSDIVREYADWTNNLSAQIMTIVNQRKQVQDDREKHPLPKNDCGDIGK